MNFYLLPVLEQVAESLDRESAFSFDSCAGCGRRVRRQKGPLWLDQVEGFSALAMTLDGDLVAIKELALQLIGCESSLETLAANLEGVPGEWYQVKPSVCVELAESSFRSPRENCKDCGGVARIRFAPYPPLELTPQDSYPSFFFACGAPQMSIVDDSVFSLLARFEPDLVAQPVRVALGP